MVLLVLANAVEQEVYVVTLKYDGEALSKESIYVTRANYLETRETGPFTVRISSFDNKTLYTKRFDVPLNFSFIANPEWFDENGTQVVIPPKAEVHETAYKELILPFFENAMKIEIDKSGEKILEISVVQFARTCGDAVCQEHESYLTCEADCTLTQQPSGEMDYRLFVAGLALVIIIVYLTFIKK